SPEEYAAAYIFDRIDTTATTFMALTMRCSQCHDHKYEPITQKEYYQFYAFFNNVPEQGLDGQKGNAAPFIKAPMPGQQEQLDGYDQKIAAIEGLRQARVKEAAPAAAAWEKEAPATLAKAAPGGLVAHYGFDEMSGEQVRATPDGVPAVAVSDPPAATTAGQP